MKVPLPDSGEDPEITRWRIRDRLREAYDLLRNDEKIQKAAGAIVLLGFVAFATAGLGGLLVLGLALVIAAALPSIRQRVRRWYLLG